MDTVSADSLTKEMVLVESVDNQIGYALESEAKPALLSYTEERLFQLEQEVSIRDVELIKNIEIINDLYESYSYRTGRFLIKPVELVLLKLRMIKPPKSNSNFGDTSLKRND